MLIPDYSTTQGGIFMDTYNAYDIYKDIRTRTGGDIYLGVVGPVRTGKSTFIRKFANLMILPYIEDKNVAGRIRDELPQSGTGRTIMTTEPKFVPAEAAEIKLGSSMSCRIRLIDCVGYMVEGAYGASDPENSDNIRMISTPWDDEPLPFDVAAEMGTRRVISEHSTIGIVVTTDGSISSIPRNQYAESEERVIKELKKAHKPFIVVLNTTDPYSEETMSLAQNLEEKYDAPVIPADCLNMSEEHIAEIITDILYQFPASRINIKLPGFIDGLDISHNIKQKLIQNVREWSESIETLRDVIHSCDNLTDGDVISDAAIMSTDPGTGNITIELSCVNGLFYKVIGEIMDCSIKNDRHFFELIKDFSHARKAYEKLQSALTDVEQTGYGIVRPHLSEMSLETPEMFRQGNKYGVKIKAKAPSLHIIRTDITTEISPIVGSENQSRDLISYLNEQFRENPSSIWETNIFGKTLFEMVNEQIDSKLSSVPADLQYKIRRSLQKVSDEGKEYFICIII